MNSRHRSSRMALVLGLAALWAVFLGAEVLFPFFFLHDDNAMQLTALFQHDYRVLTETGRLAEINYFQFGGEPFIEEGQTAVLYPPVYLCAALAIGVFHDARLIIEFMVFFHLTLGYVGCYFFLRQLNVDRMSSVLGALAWVLSPLVLLLGASWLVITMIAGCLPWIFWAMERLLIRPSLFSSLALGGFLGFFFLEGVPQWFAYLSLFLGGYIAFRFLVDGQLSLRPVLYHLVIAGLIFLAIALPELAPTLHAANVSDQRSQPMPWQAALAGSVLLDNLFKTQFGIFQPRFLFEASSAILFCPALFLLPLVAYRYFKSESSVRQKMMPMLGLTLAAFAFSTPLHALLNLLPFFNRFRWPFKLFIYLEFFLDVVIVLTLVSWAASSIISVTRQKLLVGGVLTGLIAMNLIFSLTHHSQNFLSVADLPSLQNPLPEADPTLGRTATFGDVHLTVTSNYLSQNYGTLYYVPSVGGYDPLMGRDQSRFGVGIVDHGIDYSPVTPEIRQNLDSRATRYFIVDARTPMAAQIAALPDLKLIQSRPDRIVYENFRAMPLVYSVNDVSRPLPFTYAGNSLLIPVDHASSSIVVSLSQTDGWWHRLDSGPWQRSTYVDDHLLIKVLPSTQRLEISYFDPYFRQGLFASLLTLIVLGVVITLRRYLPVS